MPIILFWRGPKENRGFSSLSGGFGRAFELDLVAVGIGDIDRGTVAPCPVAPADLFDVNAVGCEMGAERGFVERGDLERKMVNITALGPGRRPARLPALSVERHEIDLRMARAKLDQADILLALVDGAAEDADIKGKAPVEIGDPEHDVIDAKKREGRHGES